jgi:hypothetical protein
LPGLQANTQKPGAGWVQAMLLRVSFHQPNQSLERLTPWAVYHLQFPDAFFDGQSRPPWLARVHPTWNLAASEHLVHFGGDSDNQCMLCDGQLHRLVLLDPVPPDLGVTGLPRLELATCLSCLGWEQQPLYYQHDARGTPASVSYDGPKVTPQFPVGPLQPVQARLVQTPRRWYWQDWGLSNGRENLNRVGGEPSWVQDADYPRCPSCQRLMSFLLQLDSNLTTADGGEWLWGSGGIAYGFWCDPCKVSGFLWQCT